ncbi:pentatricopeptide repeat-containing protein At1g08070, chloroplastic-like [Nymphaea colorata]|uniref:Pentatricopeptide repeat-containing protein n=1 Tax=Nymphaea colorata TaxID=210225 RepID=A0A5K1DTD1_9MAGN|nr:pentatricopeptide repeat-containing protein At1g08070, chloroplastic-like [Nymphaea colorata]XP_031485424.1 pentatricopeptide repeat-containing protein At1g08070, chloroplastic-like [Nymphaea colorata]XP_049933833.1 pentatricopeptide repeat-containing protein At1g08070, chloroplastic-like [Nymphaea colorata]XP_049933834.1 pentatricopeptide repeat-containing protein At1g08070, chloroplastic-like [Nymphaea colorata]
MEKENMKPDHYTLPFVIKGFASILDLDGGRKVHDVVRRNGYEGNLHVVTCLIDMYVRFGEIENARRLFDEMRERDVVAWTTMIGAYTQVGNWLEAFSLFRDMRLEGQEPNDVTLLSLISASSFLNFIHGMVIKLGFDTFVVIETALIDSYAKCGDVKSARELFDRMYWKNSVAWSAMICAYSVNGHPCDALFLFRIMFLCSNEMLDHIGVLSVLQACSSLGSLLVGRMTHAHILKSGIGSDSIVGTCLIDMYAKCGSVEDAFVSFHSITDKNLVSWSAMIAGYGFHGLGKEALDMFSEMQELGFKPDDVAFLSILSACSHSGLIGEGTKIFKSILQTCNGVARAKHYACMIDLFARSGKIGEICSLLKELPSIADASIWRGLFYACQVTADCETAEIAARNLYEVVPSGTDYNFILSNLYASCGKWSIVSKIRSNLKQNRARKTPGWSSIELNCKVHTFHSADTSHPEWQSIYKLLEIMFAEPDAL